MQVEVQAKAQSQSQAQARAQAKARAKPAAKAERSLPVFRLVARCTEPKPPSPIGSAAISQRTLSSLNFVSLPLPLELLLPPPRQPMSRAKIQNSGKGALLVALMKRRLTAA